MSNTNCRNCLLILLFCGYLSTSLAQHAYEASWKAGFFGVYQNPASIVSSPYETEFLIGSANLTARNNLFETNDLATLASDNLIQNLFANYNDLAFLTGIDDPNDYYREKEAPWYSSNRNQFPLLGIRFRITNGDWIERGIARGALAFRFERNEEYGVSGIDAELAERLLTGSIPSNRLSFQEDYYEISVREWDAFVVNLGVTLGRSKNLFHIALGGKLLSANAYMDWKAYDSSYNFDANSPVYVQSDSVAFAYNPSFEEAFSPDGSRRFNNFENSWGFAGEIGLIYQLFNHDQKPSVEVGASVQDIGVIQFWNLSNNTYTLNRGAFFPSRIQDINEIELLNNSLTLFSDTQIAKEEGVTEKLPLRITAHAKVRFFKSNVNLQLAGFFRKSRFEEANWESTIRTTLSLESKAVGFYFPFSFSRIGMKNGQAIKMESQLGVIVSISNFIIVGSNDLVSSFIKTATRSGAMSSNLFVGARIPLKSDY